MIKKISVQVIRWAFTTAAITLLCPLVLPFYHFRGGFLAAIICGVVMQVLYPLMRRVIYKFLGLVHGTCPMPKYQKWLILSFWLGTSLTIWLGALVAPSYLRCGGILGAIPAGLLVLIGTTLANFATVLITGTRDDADDQTATSSETTDAAPTNKDNRGQ